MPNVKDTNTDIVAKIVQEKGAEGAFILVNHLLQAIIDNHKFQTAPNSAISSIFERVDGSTQAFSRVQTDENIVQSFLNNFQESDEIAPPFSRNAANSIHSYCDTLVSVAKKILTEMLEKPEQTNDSALNLAEIATQSNASMQFKQGFIDQKAKEAAKKTKFLIQQILYLNETSHSPLVNLVDFATAIPGIAALDKELGGNIVQEVQQHCDNQAEFFYPNVPNAKALVRDDFSNYYATQHTFYALECAKTLNPEVTPKLDTYQRRNYTDVLMSKFSKKEREYIEGKSVSDKISGKFQEYQEAAANKDFKKAEKLIDVLRAEIPKELKKQKLAKKVQQAKQTVSEGIKSAMGKTEKTTSNRKGKKKTTKAAPQYKFTVPLDRLADIQAKKQVKEAFRDIPKKAKNKAKSLFQKLKNFNIKGFGFNKKKTKTTPLEVGAPIGVGEYTQPSSQSATKKEAQKLEKPPKPTKKPIRKTAIQPQKKTELKKAITSPSKMSPFLKELGARLNQVKKTETLPPIPKRPSSVVIPQQQTPPPIPPRQKKGALPSSIPKKNPNPDYSGQDCTATHKYISEKSSGKQFTSTLDKLTKKITRIPKKKNKERKKH